MHLWFDDQDYLSFLVDRKDKVLEQDVIVSSVHTAHCQYISI